MSGSNPLRVTVRTRQTRCYELAGRGMLDAPDDCLWILVHGRVNTMNGQSRIGHAWHEHPESGLVYDPVFNTTTPKAEYYEGLRAEVVAVFTRAQALEQMVLTGHWGPWRNEQ